MAQITKDLITQPLAGEALTATEAVYISDGTGADAARTAGSAYKLDITIAERSTFAGFVKADALSGANVKVVNSGRVKGFTGLALGKTIWASDSTPGAYTATEPSVSVPLGIAESATIVIATSQFGKQDNLSGKALIDPSRSDVKKDTKANLVTYASTASNGQTVYATDTKEFFIITDAALSEVGGGSAGLDLWLSDDFSTTAAADFTTGNNVVFNTAGAVSGALVDETVNPLTGNRSIKFTAGAASLNDWISSPIKNTDLKQRGNDSGINLYFTYDGTTDIEVVIWDVTNSKKLSSSLDVVNTQGNSTRYSTSFFVPTSCTQIQYGFHFLVAPTNGDILIFDDVELSTNPFVYKDIIETDIASYTGYISTDGSSRVKLKTVLTDPINGIISTDNSGTFTKYTFLKDASFTADSNANGSGSSGFIEIRHNNSSDILIKRGGGAYAASGVGSCSLTGNAKAGDYIEMRSQGVGIIDNTLTNFNIQAQALTEHIVTPAKSNLFDWIDDGATTIGATTTAPIKGTPSIDNQKWRRVGDTMEVQLNFSHSISAGSTTGSGDYLIDYPAGVSIDTSKFALHTTNSSTGHWDVSSILGSGQLAPDVATTATSLVIVPYSATQFRVVMSNGGSTGGFWGSANANMTNNVFLSAKYTFPVLGWDSNSQFLAAIPKDEFQTKILSADHNAATSDVASLTFNNLTIGKSYNISGILKTDTSGAAGYIYTFNDQALNVGNVIGEITHGTLNIHEDSISFTFVAKTSNLFLNANTAGTPPALKGSGTRNDTFITLTELNTTKETTKFS